MNTISCPHCGKQVELSEAIIHQLSEKVRSEEQEKAKAQMEKTIALQKVATEKRLREELQEESKQKEKEIQESKRREKELEEKLTKEKKDREQNEEKIKQDAQRQANEANRLEKLELEKKLSDTRRDLEAAQRSAKQSSQQLQGEVLELDLEERLKSTFLYDEFLPVPKGITGGDIIHIVRNKFSQVAGSILWETKRSKDWKKLWLVKLREDMRKISASECILVSEVLPDDIKVYERVDNVWVTSYIYAIPLAKVLRDGLMKIAIAKSGASHTDEKLKGLYKLITSDSFKNKFEARNETIAYMKAGLESDRRTSERAFKRRQIEIDKLERNNDELYSELQAHVPSLPPLKEPNILKLESGESENDSPNL